MLAVIRQSYWIIQGGAAVKATLGRCIPCRKRRARLGEQMMASLPLARIQNGWFPFMYVGVDYFGPLQVKINRHFEKRYGCVFICLQCRAVHLELAHSLTTDSFILALMRFVSRRGKPKEIFSDNGTNFVGTESELKSCLQELSQEAINGKMLFHGIQWHFQPPAASHRGGVWERMIRSIRKILTVLINDQVVNDETLLSFLAEVERILNDRPLIPTYAGVEEPCVLKPSQLLMLRECESAVPETSGNMIYRRWKQVNYLASVFWNRWVKEYLPTLQSRQKWLNPTSNFRQGDIVLIVTEPSKRMRWPMRIVEECLTDEDGLVRTAFVRTVNGLYKRDIRKLCLLERVGEPEL